MEVEGVGEISRLARKPGEFEPGEGLALGGRAAQPLPAEHRGQHDILQHAQVRERPGNLVGARDPGARDSMCFQVGEIATLEDHAPRIRAVMAAQQIPRPALDIRLRVESIRDSQLRSCSRHELH